MTAVRADPASRRAFVELLRFADPGIDDVVILSGDGLDPLPGRVKRLRRDLLSRQRPRTAGI